MDAQPLQIDAGMILPAQIAVVRRPGSALAPLYAVLARRIGVARRLSSAPSLVVLDGRRNAQSSTRLRAWALGAAAEAVLNLTP